MARVTGSWVQGLLAVVLAGAMGCQGKPAKPAPVALAAPAAPAAPVAGKLDRTVLPIPEPVYPPITELDARKATPPPRFEVKAPDGAPNVVVILIDDMGFGVPSTFGGPAHMPTADRLASEGLRYNQFHTTALCSPTRTALLSGRNHHSNNMGSIAETGTGFPGNTGQRPDNVAPLAEMLRLNGYSTSFYGKNHETATWEISPSGPTTRWPNRSGFDEFYGFMGGETNQWAPLVYHNQTMVELPKDPKYHFMNDMTNHAIAWVQYQKSLTPDRPFFMYFAPGATHAPHHVPKEWIAKYKGKFDKGWDALREETLARQIKLGVVPPGTKLAPKPEAIKDWATLSAQEKKLFTRQMEIYAGVRRVHRHRDRPAHRRPQGDRPVRQHAGLLHPRRQRHERRGRHERHVQRDDLLQRRPGDGRRHHEALRRARRPDVLPAHGGRLGGRRRHAVHLDQAGGLQLRRHPQRHGGPLAQAASRPGARSARSSTTSSTWRRPSSRRSASRSRRASTGRFRSPSRVSAWPTPSTTPKAESRHKVQYFEIFGNRGIYADGWLAGTVHRAPWEMKPRAAAPRGPVGALRHAQRLQPGERSRRAEPGQAEGAPGPLHEGGGQVQRPPHRRPGHRAARRQAGRAARPDGRPHVAHACTPA